MTEPAAEWVPLDKLTPWAANPRRNDHAVEQVAASIDRFGFASPIIARPSGEVIAGHTRLKAAQHLGLDLVPVRYLDLSDVEARALAVADNRLGELADWDDGGLAEVMRAIEADGGDLGDLGWDSDELADVLKEPPAPTGEDEAPEVQPETHSKSGEVYQLGPHRLACGDSTDASVWEALLSGDRIQCVWTDPPYGISYVGKTADALTIENDSMSPEDTAKLWDATFEQLKANAKPGAAWYAAAPAGPIFWRLGQVLEGYNWRRTLVWVKDRFVMGRGDYHYRHEPIFHGWFEGAARLHPVPRTVDTVQECKRPGASKEHPTMKPLDLIKPMLRNSAKKGWVVADPFGGSGSTLMAAAAEGMVCRTVELDPKYCDVIRRRWTRHAKENDLDPGTGALDG